MTTRWLAVVALVGCGAKPAEPLESPSPVASRQLLVPMPLDRDGSQIGAFPRPVIGTSIDPPDIAELGRWPLTIAEHPALEPHFDIAGALADPGITWTDLCVRGAQHRHLATQQELVDYLDAWCSAAAGDFDAAIGVLGRVRHSSNAPLVRTLRYDVASLVAAHGSAHDLESFLRNGGFLETEVVDLGAAAYFEIGKLDDAAEANKLAQDMDRAPTESARCSRMLRAIADTTNSVRDAEIDNLRAVAMVPAHDVRTPHCRSEYEMVRCWNGGDCDPYWAKLVPAGDLEGIGLLANVYRSWPTFRTANDWRFAAARLTLARPIRDSYPLLVPAIELSLRLSKCDLQLDSDLEETIQVGLTDLSPQPRSNPRWSRELKDEEQARALEVSLLRPEEIKAWRMRLDAALAQVQHMWKLDDGACAKYTATLPPVQR